MNILSQELQKCGRESALKWVSFKNGIDSTCRLETIAFAKWVVKTHLGTIERIRVPLNTF